MPGSGKSTCGVLAAKALCMDFMDTDLVIQRQEGMPLQAIISERGNGYFATAEESAICALDLENSVVATGGSVVYSDKAMAHLKSNALVLCLRISYDTMLGRIADISSRGILLKEGETLETMFAERVPIYERYADHIVDCDDKEVAETVTEIVQIVRAGNAL